MGVDPAFDQWSTGVLAGIGAPKNSVTLDVLWAWGHAESDPYPIMHIDNPLDTTWGEPGATPWNTFGDGNHVWIYPSIAESVDATVRTLLDGYYPTILSHLRNSVPRAQWGDACTELGKWGTGCAWLGRFYGDAPGVIVPPPAVVRADDDYLEVLTIVSDSINLLVQGTDNGLWHLRFDPVTKAWDTTWKRIGQAGSVLATPGKLRYIRRENGDLHVFALGSGNAVFEIISIDDGVTWGDFLASGGAEGVGADFLAIGGGVVVNVPAPTVDLSGILSSLSAITQTVNDAKTAAQTSQAAAEAASQTVQAAANVISKAASDIADIRAHVDKDMA